MVGRWLKNLRQAPPTNLNLLAGASGLQKDVSKKVKSVSAPDIIAKIDADISALQKKADEARAKIAAIKSATPDIQLGLDISELETKAEVVRQKLASLRQLDATPKVNADIAAAEAQLGRIETKLSALEYKRSTAKVDADTAAAESELRGIESQITRLNGQRATVQANADGAAQAVAQLSAVDQKRRAVDGSNASVNIAASGGAQASGILGAIVAGLAAVASVAPAAAAGLATVLSAGSGAAQAAGAVTAGFSGIGDAIKAVEADEKSAATASSGAASSRVNSAGQIASAQSALAAAVMQADRVAITGAEAVADAARAEAQAAIAADRARITSAQQVAAARRAVADAIVSASERTQAAERAVGRAQESVTFAQEALTRARRDAAEANEDLQLSLSGIAISERRALLSQKKAQAALAKGSSDPLEQEELKLNVDEAEQNLKEVRERYGDLRQEQAAFAKGGVEGSTQVTAATRSLKDAQTSAADAQRALTAAQRDGSRQVQDAAIAAAQAQQQAAWTVQDAQTAQSDAARATAKAARDAGWAQQDAARGVSEAQRGLQQALASTAKQAGATGAAGKQSAFALAQLTPAGRDFVDFWSKTWKPSMQDVTNSVAGSMLPRVQTAMFQLLGLQPTLKKGLSDTGAVLGDLAIKGSNLATSPAFRRDFAAIMDSNNRSLTSWGQAGLYGVDAARALTVAGLPLQERLARTAESAMQGVTSFILQKEASGELGQFMQFAGDKAAQLWGVTMDLVGAAYQLGVAIAPVGSVVMDLVGGMFQLVGEFAQANPGMIQFAAVCGIGLAALNALAKGAVALKASAALSMTGLTSLASGVRMLSPAALVSTTAMGTLMTRTSGMAQKFGVGSAAANTFGARVGVAASGLPLLGLAIAGVAIATDAMTTSYAEANDVMLKGGAPRAQMTAQMQEESAHLADIRNRFGGVIASMEEWHDANVRGSISMEEYNRKNEERRAGLSNLERAQEDATIAQGNYEQAVRQFGATSPQAVAALGDLNQKTRDVEIAQVAVREKTDLATAAVLYQRDQMLAGADANLRARLAAQQLAKDQDALAKAINQYGANSQQAKDAGLQLEQSQLRAGEAAKSSAGGQNAYVESIKKLVSETKGEFTPTLVTMISSLDRAGLAAVGARVEFDGAGRAVARMPNGKTVVLDAQTPALAGIDGVTARLAAVPAGKSINVGVIDEQAKLALQQLGITVTTLPDGTVDVKANDLNARTTLNALILFANAQVTNPKIAADPALFNQTLLAKMNEARASVGLPMLSARDPEFYRILNLAKDNAFRTIGVPGIGGDPNRLPGGFNPVLNKTIGDANKRWAHINIGAKTEQVWQDLKKAVDNLPGIKPGTNPIRVPIMIDGKPFGAPPGRAHGGLIRAYAAGGRVQGFPTGGNVRGPGGPTADKVPAMLSDGEYVIRAAAVRRVGVPALDAINHLRDGGMVAPLQLAAGGSATTPDAAATVPAAAVDAAVDPAAASSSDALAGSLNAAAVAAGVLNPALAALALTQSSLLVPAQNAVTLGQQAMAAAVWTTLAPALGLYQQQVGVAAPLANQALQAAQLATRVDTDATALNTGLNSTAMATSIAAMSLAAQLQHQGLRAGQFATRLDTDATRVNSQLNNTAMTLSTEGMSLQGQLQHQLLRAGQLATQQHTTLTAQNTAANNTNMIATTQAMSAQNQNHLLNLRNAQGVTTQATTAFANAWQAQLGRTIPDSGNPIKWVINFPIRSITDAWNHLDAQFALGKKVAPYVPNFARGGVFAGAGAVSGPGGPTDDLVNARLSDGEFVVRAGVAQAHMPFLTALNDGQIEARQAAGGRRATMPGYASGGPVAAAQQFARAQAGKPYVWGGVGPNGYDCSGLVSAVTNVARGQAPHRRLGTAGSFPWAGFTPGLTSALAAGASSGHIAGTIGGMNFEAQQQGVPVKVGGGAAGADHRQFNKRASLPMVGGQFVSGGAGGGGGFDPTPIVEAAFAKAAREVADVPKFFGPSAQVGRDQGVARFSLDKVKAAAMAKVSAAVGTMDVSGISGPVVEQVRQVAARYGWGAGPNWDNGIFPLVAKESSWNPNAANRSSSARGLFQKMTSIHGPIEPTPAGQAAWGLNYIKSRYGNPVAAWAFHRSHGYYGDGGVVPGRGTKDTVPAMLTPRERVLDPIQAGQYDTLGQLVGRNGIRVEGLEQNTPRGGAQPLVGTVENHYHGDQRGGDMRDLAHTLRRARVAAGS